MPGLLDFALSDPALMQNPLFNIGAGLLERSGATPFPTGFGANLGGAVQGATNRSIQSEQLQEARQRLQLSRETHQLELDQVRQNNQIRQQKALVDQQNEQRFQGVLADAKANGMDPVQFRMLEAAGRDVVLPLMVDQALAGEEQGALTEKIAQINAARVAIGQPEMGAAELSRVTGTAGPQGGTLGQEVALFTQIFGRDPTQEEFMGLAGGQQINIGGEGGDPLFAALGDVTVGKKILAEQAAKALEARGDLPEGSAQKISDELENRKQQEISRFQGRISTLDGELDTQMDNLRSAAKSLSGIRNLLDAPKAVSRYNAARERFAVTAASRANFQGEPQQALINGFLEQIPGALGFAIGEVFNFDQLEGALEGISGARESFGDSTTSLLTMSFDALLDLNPDDLSETERVIFDQRLEAKGL